MILDPSILMDELAGRRAVLVALSGGADSLALLHLLRRAAAGSGCRIHACHVHHGMRGGDADEDAAYLEELCEEWEIPLHVERVDVPALARQYRMGLEEAGRDARIASFALVARREECEVVMTAHHADDQVETILLNLFRGCSIGGLGGMPARRPLTREPEAPLLVRPLLGVRRRDIEEYCRIHNLNPRHDRTNDDLRYRRNRLRHELLPLLEGEYDPLVKQHLLRLGSHAAEVEQALAACVDSIEAEAVVPHADGSAGEGVLLTLERRVLTFLGAAVRSRLLIRLLEKADPRLRLSTEFLNRIDDLVYEKGPNALDLPGAPLRLVRRGDRLTLVTTNPPAVEGWAPFELKVGGSGGPCEAWAITLRVSPVPDRSSWDGYQASLSPRGVRLPLTARPWRPGDRMAPLGGPGTRRVADLLREARIPYRLRRSRPVVCDSDGIVWTPGCAIAERAKLEPDESECLLLEARETALSGRRGDSGAMLY